MELGFESRRADCRNLSHPASEKPVPVGASWLSPVLTGCPADFNSSDRHSYSNTTLGFVPTGQGLRFSLLLPPWGSAQCPVTMPEAPGTH